MFILVSVFSNLGRNEEAIFSYTHARKGFLKEGMIADAANCDLNLGIVHRDLGLNHEAISANTQAREVFLK